MFVLLSQTCLYFMSEQERPEAHKSLFVIALVTIKSAIATCNVFTIEVQVDHHHGQRFRLLGPLF